MQDGVLRPPWYTCRLLRSIKRPLDGQEYGQSSGPVAQRLAKERSANGGADTDPALVPDGTQRRISAFRLNQPSGTVRSNCQASALISIDLLLGVVQNKQLSNP